MIGCSVKKKGYSLIELLVVISVMLLVLGGGIATYMSFNEKQTVLEATNQLKTYLFQAQSNARNGIIVGCVFPLKSYRISVSSYDPPELSIREICDDGTPYGSVGSVSVKSIPSGISISPFTVDYKVLHGGIIGADSDLQITVSGNNRNYSFKITRGGEITTGEWD